jgi:hypothetical protein
MGVPVIRIPGDELFQEPEPLVGIPFDGADIIGLNEQPLLFGGLRGISLGFLQGGVAGGNIE